MIRKVEGREIIGNRSAPKQPEAASLFDFIDLDLLAGSAMQEGRLAWNETDHTLNVGMEGGSVVLQVGQEMLARVRNVSGGPITNGQVVYVFGATGQTPTVKPASASSYDETIRTIAMATEDIADNGFGYVNTFGVVRDLNTAGIAEGAVVYLGENGAFTAVEPAYPLNRMAVGVCLYENANNGKVFFNAKMFCRKFGTPGAAGPHYTGFDDKGHQRMYGDARPFRDELGDALSLKVQGTGISTNAAEGTQDFATNADLNDYLFANVQLNHDRDLAAVIKPHLHFFQASAAVPNFLLQYRWQKNGGAKTTAWASLKCDTTAFAYSSGTMHQIAHTAAGIVPPVDTVLSDIVQFRVLRDNANASGLFAGADPYAGAVGVLSFDVHLQLNSIGSDEEYVK